MPNEDVLDNEAVDQPAAPKGQAETVTVSKAELARMERELGEARASERFWADRARGNGNGHPQQAAPAEEEDPIETSDLLPPAVTGTSDVDEAIFHDPDKWLEAISKGPRAIQALVAKATEGYVNAQQVAEIAAKVARRTVDVERGKISTDSQLMTKFPELADNKSALVRATAEEFQELIAFDPQAKKSPATLFAAAKAAKSRLAMEARSKKDDGDDGDEYDRVETDRRARVAAQDNRPGRAPLEDPDDSLGPQAKQLVKQMGITNEEFLTEKKKTDGMRRRR
jgi:hypothetical protein